MVLNFDICLMIGFFFFLFYLRCTSFDRISGLLHIFQ